MDWIDSAKADRENGMSYRAIAKKYNKAYGTIYNHLNNETRRTDFHNSSIEYRNDGVIISEKFITVRDGDDMTPEFIIEAHGLKPSVWEVVSYKNNFWNSQLKGGFKQISYQSKLTVKPREEKYQLTTEQIEKNFDELERIHKPMILLPKTQSGNLMAEVNIADLHTGRLCWHGDTGNNFDYKIARSVFRQIISDTYHELKGKPIEYILFPIGNDLVNSDTPDKGTTAGTPQDTDIRWQKLTVAVEDMLIEGFDQLKEIAPIKAFYVASNHDEVTTFGIAGTVAAWFRNDPRVEVDRSAISRKYHLYGNNLTGFSHGSNEKPGSGNKYRPSKLAALMPVEARSLWAQAKFCEFHAAHLHTEHAIEEINGVMFRRISSPTAPDTWTFESGYIGSVRKAQTFIYDKEAGMKYVFNMPVREVV